MPEIENLYDMSVNEKPYRPHTTLIRFKRNDSVKTVILSFEQPNGKPKIVQIVRGGSSLEWTIYSAIDAIVSRQGAVLTRFGTLVTGESDESNLSKHLNQVSEMSKEKE